MSQLFGWDLLYGSVEKDVKCNQDVLVCLTHLVLISNGFKCIGLGDSKNFDGTEPQSEALPKGWHEDYALRYVYQGKLYNLKGTKMDDGVVINLIRVDERNVAMLQLNTRMVVSRTGLLAAMVPEHAKIVDTIKKQLVDKVVTSTRTADGSSQTTSNQNQPQRGIGPIAPLCNPIRDTHPVHVGIPDPLGVGSNDLHPLGPGPLRGKCTAQCGKDVLNDFRKAICRLLHIFSLVGYVSLPQLLIKYALK